MWHLGQGYRDLGGWGLGTGDSVLFLCFALEGSAHFVHVMRMTVWRGRERTQGSGRGNPGATEGFTCDETGICDFGRVRGKASTEARIPRSG